MKKGEVFAHVLDGLDIETYLICEDEKEGRALALALMETLGFKKSDVIMIEPIGGGVRVRMRAVIHSPNDEPDWLEQKKEEPGTGDGKKKRS